MTTESILAEGRRVLDLEARAIATLADRLGESFEQACRLLAGCEGRVVVSGIGKSGIVARKIAATLTSTGTQATFLHPIDGLHGDLGIVGRRDVALMLSKSGETGELEGVVEYFHRVGVPIIAITGRPGSSLGRDAAVVLDASVEEEACPMDLAPTTSTTASLAIGDALAVVVLQLKGFAPEDFARLHPGGALGKRLRLRVRDVMVTDAYPSLPPEAPLRDAVVPIAEQRGTVPVVDGEGRVVGVLTAGDLTRRIERDEEWAGRAVGDVMTTRPRLASADELGSAAVYRMEEAGIMALPVVAEDGRLEGVVHLHDLMRAGAV